jgi:CheY-like chemotaxis protein
MEVLVVDDRVINLRLIRAVLENRGFTVRGAGSAEEGLAMVRQRPPDVILMDISLPGMSGLEATRILKAEPSTRGIPVVGLSAHAMKGDAEKALAAGCDGYVTKPIDTRTLASYLTELVESFRRRD